MILRVASLGGGVNSTAMILGMQERREVADLILFADTGGEKPETYAYLQQLEKWLTSHAWPAITVVRKTSKRDGRFYGPGVSFTLEEYCLGMKTLPSVAYGYKTCSLKFKREPQDEFISQWPEAIARWERGEKIQKLIGFDAGEPQRATESPDERFTNRYPLIEWGWDREECIAAITRAGLCIPPKSSCFFCPNMGEEEILELKQTHPDLLERALALEANAVATEGSSIKGLARDFSWKQIVEYDAAQRTFFTKNRKAPPCECYDGE